MDEIAGYLPPVAMPASKAPLLTLLKQARAFGVGIVLATQNPVDLDYKALSNAGTWLIGRLQTERDQLRLLDGLESVMSSAGGAFDRDGDQPHDRRPRQAPVPAAQRSRGSSGDVFESRWAMSYLRGPLTRAQIKTLMADEEGARGWARVRQVRQVRRVRQVRQVRLLETFVEAGLQPRRSRRQLSLPTGFCRPAFPQYFAPAPRKERHSSR